MRMQNILTLAALGEAGSIRAAASTLGRSQPGLTKILKQIEDDLKVSLFTRSPRGVLPTEIGQVVLARARTIAADVRRLREEVDQIVGHRVGSVSICASPLAATQIVPMALAAFRKKYSEIDVRITGGSYPAALGPLRDGQTTMIVGPRPPAHAAQGIAIEPLFETEIVVVTSRTSRYAQARSLEELSDAQWMMIGSPGGPGDIFAKPFREHGFRVPSARISSESYMAAFEIVRALDLICTFPARLLKLATNSADLVVIPIKETIDSISISLMTRAEIPLTPAEREMANCIRRRSAAIAIG